MRITVPRPRTGCLPVHRRFAMGRSGAGVRVLVLRRGPPGDGRLSVWGAFLTHLRIASICVAICVTRHTPWLCRNAAGPETLQTKEIHIHPMIW